MLAEHAINKWGCHCLARDITMAPNFADEISCASIRFSYLQACEWAFREASIASNTLCEPPAEPQFQPRRYPHDMPSTVADYLFSRIAAVGVRRVLGNGSTGSL